MSQRRFADLHFAPKQLPQQSGLLWREINWGNVATGYRLMRRERQAGGKKHETPQKKEQSRRLDGGERTKRETEKEHLTGYNRFPSWLDPRPPFDLGRLGINEQTTGSTYQTNIHLKTGQKCEEKSRENKEEKSIYGYRLCTFPKYFSQYWEK